MKKKIGKTGTEMTVSRTDAAISPVIDIAGLITAAAEKGMSPETVQKFLDMRKQLKDEYAKEQYFLSLAKLQGELPTIEKEKEVVVDSKVIYRYAPIEKIVEKVQQLIADNGFSYSFKDRQDEKGLTVVCESHHVAGHTETHELTAASNVSGKMMNAVQGLGATKTYLKRYVFCDTYGIMTGDEDTDAVDENKTTQSATPAPAKVETVKELTPEQKIKKELYDACISKGIKIDVEEMKKKSYDEQIAEMTAALVAIKPDIGNKEPESEGKLFEGAKKSHAELSAELKAIVAEQTATLSTKGKVDMWEVIFKEVTGKKKSLGMDKDIQYADVDKLAAMIAHLTKSNV